MFVVQPSDLGNQLFDSLYIDVSNHTHSPDYLPRFRVPCIVELNVSDVREAHLSQEPKLAVIHEQLLQITTVSAMLGRVDWNVGEIILETSVIQHGVDYLLQLLRVCMPGNPDQLPNPRLVKRGEVVVYIDIFHTPRF